LETPQNLSDLSFQVSKENLHVVISMAPAGNNLRNRVRKFPALINYLTFDCFNEWPKKLCLM
jgi:dynein heavy chain